MAINPLDVSHWRERQIQNSVNDARSGSMGESAALDEIARLLSLSTRDVASEAGWAD